MSSRKNRQQLVALAALVGTALALTGCGKQAFVVTELSASIEAPGTYSVAPKVDLLMVVDDTGSMSETLPQIAYQMPVFLQGLEARKWDYHFATASLTKTTRDIHQVTASRHDTGYTSYGIQWLPPFPGAIAGSLPGMVDSDFFVPSNHYNDFIPQQPDNSLGSVEPGFAGIKDALIRRLNDTGFIRNDAMLVILVVGNGQDTSGVTFCTNGWGQVLPCEQVSGVPTKYWTSKSSFDAYKADFQAVKPNGNLKFYAAVAKNKSTSCVGGYSYPGTRYMDMATALGGASYDICTRPLTSVLDSLADSLQTQKQNFRTKYLFLKSRPNESTIQVTKFLGGNLSQPVTLTRGDTANGFTYAGNLTNVDAIDAPIGMNKQSGYAIELHGSARLLGDDTASIKFAPYGSTSASEQ